MGEVNLNVVERVGQNPVVFIEDLDDPNINPNYLLFYNAKVGSISGMEEALQKGADLSATFPITNETALHFAATCEGPAGTEAVRWILQQGIGWAIRTHLGLTEDQVAEKCGNEESCKVIREWMVQQIYEIFHNARGGEYDPDRSVWQQMRIEQDRKNRKFCTIMPIMYTQPPGAPDGEIAMVSGLSDRSGIMMEWERPIMREAARRLLDGMPKSGLRVLNIGFGLGMIDTYFQNAHPEEHVIIEAHSECLDWMRSKGWYNLPGVRILEGRWQKFLVAPLVTYHNDADDIQSLPDLGKFDVVYFDTFEEGYDGFFTFIQHVPRLLRGPGSRFSFSEGQRVWIYREVRARHLNDFGMNIDSTEVHIDKDKIWTSMDRYGEGALEENENGINLVSICALAPTIPRTLVPGVGWNSHGEATIIECEYDESSDIS